MNSQNKHTNWKLEHEQFVTGHNGSDVLDISLVALSAPVAFFCFKLAVLYIGCSKTRFLKKFFIEFVILVGLPLLSLTVFASSVVETLLVVLSLCVTALFWQLHDCRSTHIEIISDEDDNLKKKHFEQILSNRPSFLGNYRAYVNVATAICILAVDFEIFPRRFCKTENFGTGLMDIGVGSFIVSNAIVSKEARECSKRTNLRQLVRTLVSTWPLLLLGIGRLISLKSVDYHEHVTEYGTHWNFFFTLSFVKVASALTFSVVPPKHSLFVSMVVCGVYETLLSRMGLSSYLLAEGNRSHLFHANREGIFSSLGYLALYLASVRLGTLILSRHSRHRSAGRRLLMKSIKLLSIDVVLWLILHYCRCHDMAASRRMANLPYVIWMMAYNILMLLSFFTVDIIVSYIYGALERSDAGSESFLLDAINRNGLFFFLLSNILTGIVNMTFNTMQVDNLTTVFMLFVYMFCLCLVMSVFRYFNILVKFW